MATFSPLFTSDVNSRHTSTPGHFLLSPSSVSVCFPEGRLTKNWMNGRSMFDFFKSETCSFSISFLRLCTCDARVPAPKRATKSWSCAIFLRRSSFSASTRPRTWLLAITISS